MPLDPQAANFLNKLAAVRVPPPHTLSVAEARAQVMPVFGAQAEVARIKDRQIPGPGGELAIRLYEPTAGVSAAGASSKERQGAGAEAGRPAILFFHGGGWVLCNLGTHDALCRLLAQTTGCTVVSVDYRLAPEHRFPAAAEDCYAATAWVAEHARELGIRRDRLAVAGDSAGGNLAAAVALMARDRGGPALACQLLIYPITDHVFDTRSYLENAEGYGLARQTMIWFWDQYVPHAADRDNPYAAPLRANDLARLPAAYVLTVEYDPLRDEGEAYAGRLEKAGVPVQSVRLPGMIHGFLRRTNDFHQVETTLQQMREVLEWAFEER